MKRRELITALGAATVLMAMIGGFAWVQWGKADRADSFVRREGKNGDMILQHRFMAPTLAVTEFFRMQRNSMCFLAELATIHQCRVDDGTALLTKLERLP